MLTNEYYERLLRSTPRRDTLKLRHTESERLTIDMRFQKPVSVKSRIG